MTAEEAAKTLVKLSELKEKCLLIHNDSITYQVCEILQEIVIDIISKE